MYRQIIIAAIVAISTTTGCKTTKQTTRYDTLSIHELNTHKWLQRADISLHDTLRISISKHGGTADTATKEITIVRHLRADTETMSKDTTAKSEVHLQSRQQTTTHSGAPPIQESHKARLVLFCVLVVGLGFILVWMRRR